MTEYNCTRAELQRRLVFLIADDVERKESADVLD